MYLPLELQAIITDFVLRQKLLEVQSELKQKVTLTTTVDCNLDFLHRLTSRNWERSTPVLSITGDWGKRCVASTKGIWIESCEEFLFYKNAGHMKWPDTIPLSTKDRAQREVYNLADYLKARSNL